MDTTKSLQDYLEELSSSSPTPGGGNVAALSGALACSLGIMVCNLTIGKKKYAGVEEELKGILTTLSNDKNNFLILAKEDNDAFDKVMEAFKLPKETDEEKSMRTEKIEEATLLAGYIPSKVVNLCINVLPMLKTIVVKGNQNSLSDAGVAISLIQTAAQGAFFNVSINCSSLTNSQAVDLLKKSEADFDEVTAGCGDALKEISLKLKN